MKRLIGFAGRKGSGKDTAALFLSQRKGFTKVAFADPIRIMLQSLLRYQGVPDDVINRMMFGDLKETPSPWLGNKSFREASQTLGTEWGRDTINPNLWIASVDNHIASNDLTHVVISDVRFPNESEWVRNNNGHVYRIHRKTKLNEFSNHVSEVLIDSLDVDAELHNTGSKRDLYNSLKFIFQDDTSWIGLLTNLWKRILRLNRQ